MARLGMYMQHCHSWCVDKLILLRCVRDMLFLCSLWPPHACSPNPSPPCATHLLNRRPPACMWLWTVCHRPALLPPVTMLRTLSLRLGPAPVPEQAPPPLSLAPGEGPAPPCPPLSTAPLVGTERLDRRQRNTEQTERKDQEKTEGWERDGRTDAETDAQTHTPESRIIISKVSQNGEEDTELSTGVRFSSQKPAAATAAPDRKTAVKGSELTGITFSMGT